MADKIDLSGLKDIDSLEDPAQASDSMATNDITDEQVQEIVKDIELEDKYGDRSLESVLLGGARGATLGLSDQALTKSGLYTPEELREIDDRNKAASISGEIAGTIIPAIGTGGTSLAGKGIIGGAKAVAGSGIKGTIKAGSLAEKATAKALNKVVKDTGDKHFAKEVLKKAVPAAAGSSVEGALFGTGKLISEDALGRAEFNAENLAVSAGMGALLGGVAGAGIGSVSPLLTPVKKVGALAGKQVKEKVKSFSDPVQASLETLGFTRAQQAKIVSKNPELVKELPEFLVEKLKLGKWTGADDLYVQAKKLEASSGQEISTIVNKLDKMVETTPILYRSRAATYAPILKRLDEGYIKKLAGKKTTRKQLNAVRNLRDDLHAAAIKETPLSVSEIQDLRKVADELSNFDAVPGAKLNTVQLAARDTRRALRKEIDNITDRADQVSGEASELLRRLKTANRDYSITKIIDKPLAKKAHTPTSIANFTDFLVGNLGAVVGLEGAIVSIGAKRLLEGDLVRNLKVLSKVEKANQQTNSKIVTGLKNFMKGKKAPARTVAVKALVLSPLAEVTTEGKTKKPKNQEQAFKAIRENISSISADQDKLQRTLLRGTAGLSRVAPNTAAAMQQNMLSAVQFLNSKLPKDANVMRGVKGIGREYVPSSMEVAKFARYVDAVDNPMGLLADMQNGTATREQVEAVRVVYPDLYSRVVNEALTQLANVEQQISYSKRLQLGSLLDIPADTSLVPEAIANLQQTFNPEAGEAEEAASTKAKGSAGPSKLTVSGTKNLSSAEREASGSESFAKRRREP